MLRAPAYASACAHRRHLPPRHLVRRSAALQVQRQQTGQHFFFRQIGRPAIRRRHRLIERAVHLLARDAAPIGWITAGRAFRTSAGRGRTGRLSADAVSPDPSVRRAADRVVQKTAFVHWPDDDPLDIGYHQQRRIAQRAGILQQLAIRRIQVAVLSLCFPGEAAAAPDIRPPSPPVALVAPFSTHNCCRPHRCSASAREQDCRYR